MRLTNLPLAVITPQSEEAAKHPGVANVEFFPPPKFFGTIPASKDFAPSPSSVDPITELLAKRQETPPNFPKEQRHGVFAKDSSNEQATNQTEQYLQQLMG
jgi:hypothetical protein